MEPVSVTRAYTSTGGLALCGQSGRADPAVVGPLVRRMAARMRGACAANLKARRHSPLTSIDRGTGSLCGHARSPLFAFWSLVSGLWSLVSSSNANGVASLSPGLRSLDRYPGSSCHPMLQPQRGCVPCDAAPAPTDGTALRFNMFAAPLPRVGLIAFGQPLG
jgi:hypothetical protein